MQLPDAPHVGVERVLECAQTTWLQGGVGRADTLVASFARSSS